MKRDNQAVHKAMTAVRSANTSPELLLRKALWSKNCRYRVNCKDVLGKPDIVIKKYKLAVFVDGDYWHGHNWALRGLASLEEELKNYSSYWKTKIKRNVERDLETTILLRDEGWTVLRFWGSEVKTDPDKCADIVIKKILSSRK